jgi:epoxyqueuosine reductase
MMERGSTMVSEKELIQKALGLGFDDVGFTTAEPFEFQRDVLKEREEGYAPLVRRGLDLVGGTDPKNALADARAIVVLMENYFRESFPRSMEGRFGRCYHDDDRMTKDGLSARVKAFRGWLRDNGIESKVPFNLSQRLAAARAGMGDFGKNCFFYSNRVARKSSWVLPIAVVVNRAFEPNEPSFGIGCPDWCRNACMAACPTRAITAPQRMDPRRCISYLSYYGEGLTPRELREPMGMWVYGCDVCQNVCPRNRAWLAQDLPPNERAAKKAPDFDLSRIISMDQAYYQAAIWPHMFYMPSAETWRWKMNAARAMGNSLDPRYIPELIRAFTADADERVQGMCAWALGRIGGADARAALDGLAPAAGPGVLQEIRDALEMC